MIIFHAYSVSDGLCKLDGEQSGHLVRVLRKKAGDRVNIIDGMGNLYDCILTDASSSAAVASIESVTPNWGMHPYRLTLAVAPTKNIDRYEWMVEKAVELGVDRIVPIIGEHSERKVVKCERLRRIVLSATCQSLKGTLPTVDEAMPIKEFISSCKSSDSIKLTACCFEGEMPRVSVMDMLGGENDDVIVMIGPEGDFSQEEVKLAVEAGFVPVHLGASRLRTETAALTAAEAVYLKNL